MNNDYTSEEWGKVLDPPISRMRVHQLYAEKRIPGAYIKGGVLFIPKNARDPRKPRGWPLGKKRGKTNG